MQKNLFFFILGIAFSSILFGCVSQSEVLHEHILGDILIDFQQNTQHEKALSPISRKYKMEHKSTVSSELNIHLFSFDESKISVDKLIEKVKQLDGVENAQSNKNINNRNQ